MAQTGDEIRISKMLIDALNNARPSSGMMLSIRKAFIYDFLLWNWMTNISFIKNVLNTNGYTRFSSDKPIMYCNKYFNTKGFAQIIMYTMVDILDYHTEVSHYL